MNELDLVRLNFNPQSLWVLNAIIGAVMFGVALDLKAADFKVVLQLPKPALIGMLAQFVLLPAFTFVLVSIIGRRHAADAVDGARLVLAVAEDEREGPLATSIRRAFALANVIEEAFRLEDVGDTLLQLGMGHLHAVVPREAAVADTSEKIADRIGHHEVTSSP
jgi:hypothetical protein